MSDYYDYLPTGVEDQHCILVDLNRTAWPDARRNEPDLREVLYHNASRKQLDLTYRQQRVCLKPSTTVAGGLLYGASKPKFQPDGRPYNYIRTGILNTSGKNIGTAAIEQVGLGMDCALAMSISPTNGGEYRVIGAVDGVGSLDSAKFAEDFADLFGKRLAYYISNCADTGADVETFLKENASKLIVQVYHEGNFKDKTGDAVFAFAVQLPGGNILVLWVGDCVIRNGEGEEINNPMLDNVSQIINGEIVQGPNNSVRNVGMGYTKVHTSTVFGNTLAGKYLVVTTDGFRNQDVDNPVTKIQNVLMRNKSLSVVKKELAKLGQKAQDDVAVVMIPT